VKQRLVSGRIDVAEGSHGAFARWPLGQVAALSNVDAPAKLRPSLRNPDLHQARVRAYFVNAGLPEAQIATVNNHAVMSGGGPTTTAELHGAFESYTTVLSRSIKGIPIAESFAWATFAENGSVVSESVWWPPVPSAVIEDALAITADVASGIFWKKAGVQAAAGTVLVHHTIGMGTQLEFAACLQLQSKALAPKRCIGASGSPVDLKAVEGL